MDHLGAGIGLLVVVGDRDRIELAPTESAPSSTQLGYFQVIAEPVSTWVQEIFEFAPGKRRAW